MPGRWGQSGVSQPLGKKKYLPLSLSHLFTIQQTWVGDSALADEFSEQDPKRPHIRLNGESAKEGSLWGGPLDGELGSWRD